MEALPPRLVLLLVQILSQHMDFHLAWILLADQTVRLSLLCLLYEAEKGALGDSCLVEQQSRDLALLLVRCGVVSHKQHWWNMFLKLVIIDHYYLTVIMVDIRVPNIVVIRRGTNTALGKLMLLPRQTHQLLFDQLTSCCVSSLVHCCCAESSESAGVTQHELELGCNLHPSHCPRTFG